MKYPFVLFYREDPFCSVDYFFIQHASQLECTVYITNKKEDIQLLYNSSQYHLLVCFNTNTESNKTITNQIDLRTIEITPESNIFQNVYLFNQFVNTYYVHLCSLDRQLTRPTFSMFTTSYNSFHKILRVFKSLKSQTLQDWEWVILDDSPNDDHFEFLRKQFGHEPRIRMYRRSANNGSIGNVKNESIGLCRGRYLLEMDHDDELMPYVLQESAAIFDNYSEVGFIYYDCACVYENGKNQWYGDFICKGYGGYYSQKWEDQWRLVYITPNINNVTMSHLVCCPNHPRMWRKTALMEMGSYSEYLPICDDYEILLRTAASTQIVKVHKLGYIQYMNESNNNFSLIRNREINRIGPEFISPIYNCTLTLDSVMEEKNAFEDNEYKWNHSVIWERGEEYVHKYANWIMNPTVDKQYCIIGLDSLIFYEDKLRECYLNPLNDFLVLENKATLYHVQNTLEQMGFDCMRCYSLEDTAIPHLIQYFKRMYLSVDDFAVLNVDIRRPLFNTELTLRANVINQFVQESHSYLEIGVEYGQTIQYVKSVNKIGVDPSPKWEDKCVVRKTSDVFFAENGQPFDAIFIDGMHQVEQVWKDVVHASQCLSSNGILFIDDLFPVCYQEQLKVPKKHYYEDGILKYGESWTGDVWKVVYYLLQHYQHAFHSFQYYYNREHRGVGVFRWKEKIPMEEMERVEEINQYSYWNDFNDYVLLVESSSKAIIDIDKK